MEYQSIPLDPTQTPEVIPGPPTKPKYLVGHVDVLPESEAPAFLNRNDRRAMKTKYKRLRDLGHRPVLLAENEGHAKVRMGLEIFYIPKVKRNGPKVAGLVAFT